MRTGNRSRFSTVKVTGRPPIEGQKVKPRPTFHYRLPNSMIDEPEWVIECVGVRIQCLRRPEVIGSWIDR